MPQWIKPSVHDLINESTNAPSHHHCQCVNTCVRQCINRSRHQRIHKGPSSRISPYVCLSHYPKVYMVNTVRHISPQCPAKTRFSPTTYGEKAITPSCAQQVRFYMAFITTRLVPLHIHILLHLRTNRLRVSSCFIDIINTKFKSVGIFHEP